MFVTLSLYSTRPRPGRARRSLGRLLSFLFLFYCLRVSFHPAFHVNMSASSGEMDVYFGANVHIISFSPKKVIKKMLENSKNSRIWGVFGQKTSSQGYELCVFNISKSCRMTPFWGRFGFLPSIRSSCLAWHLLMAVGYGALMLVISGLLLYKGTRALNIIRYRIIYRSLS